MDPRDVLERARRQAPVPRMTLIDLHRRRERRQRIRRIEAVVVGLAFAVASIGAASLVLRGNPATPAAGDGSHPGLPPATQAPLEAGIGQYYFEATRWHGIDSCNAEADGSSSCHFSTTEAEIWWATDESGRVATGTSDRTYAAGHFPHDTITTRLPTYPDALSDAMVARSAQEGASPEPQTTVSPGQDGGDASVEQSIVNLLEMANTTPALRAALLEVLARMPDATVRLGSTDPVGRAAYLVTVTTFGGPTVHDLYVDPATHELLAHVQSGQNGKLFSEWILEAAGVADSTLEPAARSVVPPAAAPSSAPMSDGTADVNATWPETSLVDAQQVQVRADAGDPEVQWRTDAATVALRYAHVVLGWPDPIAGVTATDDPDTVRVSLHGPDASCQGAACSAPQPPQTIVTVTLQRLMRQGDGGIWSVTVVDGSQEPSEPVPS